MIDDQFTDFTLRGVAAQDSDDPSSVLAAWYHIRQDLRSHGPFTRMLLELRAAAIEAMRDLVSVNPSEVARVAALQGEVRRYAHLMTIVSTYRSQADAAQTNLETDSEEYTEDDREFIATLE